MVFRVWQWLAFSVVARTSRRDVPTFLGGFLFGEVQDFILTVFEIQDGPGGFSGFGEPGHFGPSPVAQLVGTAP